jgi:hypothetical protein
MTQKKLTAAIFTLFTMCLVFLSSCCTNRSCDEVQYGIELYNFDPEDVDTIIIYKSYIGSHTYYPKDSTIITGVKSSGSNYYYTDIEKLDPSNDYIITVPGTATADTINGYHWNYKKDCNTCFLMRPKGNFYKKISQFNVNGQASTSPIIKIYK